MREYILSLCFALLVGVASDILVPSKKYQGIMKIICGIFLIFALINPLGNFFASGEITLDTAKFAEDDGFAVRIDESKEKFFEYLTADSMTEEKIVEELLGCDITLRKENGKTYISGVEDDKRDYIRAYAKDGMEIVFED